MARRTASHLLALAALAALSAALSLPLTYPAGPSVALLPYPLVSRPLPPPALEESSVPLSPTAGGAAQGFVQNGLRRAGAADVFRQADAQDGSRLQAAYLTGNRRADDQLAHSGFYHDVAGTQDSQQQGGVFERGHAVGAEGDAKIQESLHNGHKKGHSASGFQTSYRKDESGHNSHFYDEDHDEGQHMGARNRGDAYGVRELNQQHGQGQHGQSLGASHALQHKYGTGIQQGSKSGHHNAKVDNGYYSHQNHINRYMAEGMNFGQHPSNEGRPGPEIESLRADPYFQGIN